MHIHYDIYPTLGSSASDPRTQNYMLLSEGNSAPHVDDLMYRYWDTGQVNYLFGGVASGPRAKDRPRPRAGASASASARLRAIASLGPGVCSGSLSKILERLSS